MIEITPDVRDAMFAHAVAELPNEACALLSVADPHTLIDVFHPVANSAASATRFALDPEEMLAIERTADATGRSVVAVMHSHVDTSPYPSPTDVADSGRYDPDGTYVHVIVSLRHAEPVLRAYRIAEGQITEELVVVAEPEPTVHDQATAIAAVARLPRPSKDS